MVQNVNFLDPFFLCKMGWIKPKAISCYYPFNAILILVHGLFDIDFSNEQENPHKNDNSLSLTFIFQGEERSIEVKKKDGSYE
jgi:hypothetical protein